MTGMGKKGGASEAGGEGAALRILWGDAVAQCLGCGRYQKAPRMADLVLSPHWDGDMVWYEAVAPSGKLGIKAVVCERCGSRRMETVCVMCLTFGIRTKTATYKYFPPEWAEHEIGDGRIGVSSVCGLHEWLCMMGIAGPDGDPYERYMWNFKADEIPSWDDARAMVSLSSSWDEMVKTLKKGVVARTGRLKRSSGYPRELPGRTPMGKPKRLK